MDNFYIKIHKGEKEPFYKRTLLTEKEIKDLEKDNKKAKDDKVIFKSQYFKISPVFNEKLQYHKNNFDENLLRNIRFRQFLHSQALCAYLPLKVDLKLDSEALKCRISELKEQYIGTFDTETDWRLALGLGQASVFETSITLHHIYGIPYIPATAVKGLLRSWIITEYFSDEGKDLKNAECNAYKNLGFCKIFGAPAECEKKDKSKVKTAIYEEFKKQEKDIDAYMGDIVFFDAFPTKAPTVEVDIMNPHYPEYYNNEPDSDKFQPPADWQNPVPIFFLTVKDTSFQFLFGIRKGRENFNVKITKEEKNVIEFLRDELKEALSTHGIGAKTAVGYGRMK